MLYNSSNSECQDHRRSDGSAGGGGTGPGPTSTRTTKDNCCSGGVQTDLVGTKRNNSDGTSTCTRQMSKDSGHDSDCPDIGAQLGAAASSWNEPLATRTVERQDTLGTRRCENQETPTSEAMQTSEPTNRDTAQKRPAPSQAASLVDQQRPRLASAHQGTSRKRRWAASRSTCSVSSCPEMDPVCCRVSKPTESGYCPIQAQTPISSGQQDRSGGSGGGGGGSGDQPEEETCESPDDSDEPLDYKPILAKILNEKKLALISTPEVITFLNSGKSAVGAPPGAHKRTHM